MNITWVRLRSWHAVGWAVPDMLLTRCGRVFPATAPRSEEMPDGKSCETCLRAVARAVDAA